MVGHVAVEQVGVDPVASRELEFVERKGVGHPDSLCDGVAEAASRRLSQYYRDEFGRILPHATATVHLGAGRSTTDFGGGTVDAPISVLIGGHATRAHDGTTIPVDALAADAARDYLLETVPALHPDHVDVETRLREPSTHSPGPVAPDGVPRATSTGFGVGHAPLSPTERLVRTLEPRLHAELDAVGKDVQVVAARRNDTVHLAVVAAVLADHVATIDDYRDVTARVEALAERHAAETLDHAVHVTVNANDGSDADTAALTATGLFAETSADGAAGRGNRPTGVVTPHRPMSLGATSGQNPVANVNKLYTVLAGRIAERLHEEAAAEYSEVQLLARAGAPLTDPWAVDVATTAPDRSEARHVVHEELDAVPALTDEFVAGDVATF